MKRSGDKTHLFYGPTPTANGCDLTPPPRTQTSKQKYIALMASDRPPSTPFFCNILQNFPKGRQKMSRRHCHICIISHKIPVKINLACSSTARTKNPLRILQLCFNYCASSFFKALAMHVSYEAKE